MQLSSFPACRWEPALLPALWLGARLPWEGLAWLSVGAVNASSDSPLSLAATSRFIFWL